MKKNKIIILSGGYSEEKEVSKVTAGEIKKELSNIYNKILLIDPSNFNSYSEMLAFIKEGKPEIVFNGLHGAEGEDGRIQAMLELEGIPFTGSRSAACALTMNKYLSGIVAASLGINIPKHVLLNKNENNDIRGLKFPLVIKPNNSGSSVGISIIKSKEEIGEAMETAYEFSPQILAEEFIEGRELTVTILGDTALPIVEIVPHNGWYAYANKYTSGNSEYFCPADLTQHETLLIQNAALKIFKNMGCEVYARLDFRYKEDEVFFLEVNTLPGLTPLSLTPLAAKQAGYEFDELLMKVIKLSLEILNKKEKL